MKIGHKGISTIAIVVIVVTVVVVIAGVSAAVLLKPKGGAEVTPTPTTTTPTITHPTTTPGGTTTTTTPGTTTTTAVSVQITSDAEVYDNTCLIIVQVKSMEFERIGSCAVYITVGGAEQLVDVKPGIDPGELVTFSSYSIVGLVAGNSYQARLATATDTIKVFAIHASSFSPIPPLIASITIRNATESSTKLTIEHGGGDPIRDAFCGNAVDNHVITSENWINLEVRINGGKVTTTENKTKFNNVLIKNNTYDFIAGDILLLEKIPTLNSGDVITIIYKPNPSIPLASVTVP